MARRPEGTFLIPSNVASLGLIYFELPATWKDWHRNAATGPTMLEVVVTGSK
ncbi:hypothetical protein GA0061098_103473 [Bradyrhizobium shewense]|uniref:Uncharacterized protein n=1 Tax=Bradyrhizobium shewense TaxID=1761772 RepID=A0A1C3XS63_9BRAD|nr:hypothetical protein [Bradyrhizobium shewense]SCB55098.1 hypothetical protein GA0061098_103473 [Bradyrhizobium shewense]